MTFSEALVLINDGQMVVRRGRNSPLHSGNLENLTPGDVDATDWTIQKPVKLYSTVENLLDKEESFRSRFFVGGEPWVRPEIRGLSNLELAEEACKAGVGADLVRELVKMLDLERAGE